jgi:endonuclease IV
MFNVTAKGFLQNIKEFTTAELYIKTVDRFDYEMSQIPDNVKVISVHSPIYTKGNKFLDLTKKDVQKSSIEDINKTLEYARQYNIPKVVLHCATYKDNKVQSILALAEIVNSFDLKDIELSFETDVLWFNTYSPDRALLTSVEDFALLDSALDGNVKITLDVEHVYLTSTFNLFLEEFKVDNLTREEFETKYKEFVRDNSRLIVNTFKENFQNFIDFFGDKIVHMHINGSDYKNFLFDPETYLPLVGEHLPLGYNQNEVKDQLDYTFLIEQINKLPKDKQIHIVLELGVRNKDYDFQDSLINSKEFLESLIGVDNG